MNVLLTRPEPQATLTSNKLTDAGFTVFSEPCQMVKAVTSELQPAEGYIITSQNAIEYGLKHIVDKEAVIFTVGEKTAEAAEALGFNVIFAADGDAESLIEVILSRWLPDHGRLLHLSGAEISTDVSGLLSAIGYKAERAVVYTASKLSAPSSTTRDAIKNDEINAVLFYSARAATIFNEWIEQAGLESSLKAIDAIVLSKRIAERLEGAWKCIKIAENKHEDELIKLLHGEM